MSPLAIAAVITIVCVVTFTWVAVYDINHRDTL